MKSFKKTFATALVLIGLFLMNPGIVFAEPTAVPTEAPEGGEINLAPQGTFADLSTITASSLVSGAIKLILVVAALLFFFMLVVGGIQWIVSGGDKSGSENARKRITSALVGLAIVFAAWAIITLVKTLFGVDIINLAIPSFQPE